MEPARLACQIPRSILPLSASERLRCLSPGFQPWVMRERRQSSNDSLHPQPSTLNLSNPGIQYIEARLASLPDEALIEECRVWSVPAREIDAFSRAEARRVWAFRNRLSVDGQAAFDARPAGLRLQLAELYFEVMSSEIAPVDRPLVAPIDRLTLRAEADAQAARAAASSVD